MSGGSHEYTMANIISTDGKTMLSGQTSSYNSRYTGKVYDEGNYTSYTGVAYPDSKYYDKYSFSTSYSSRIRSKLGDGIKEVYNTGNYGWNSDSSHLARSNYPWFKRGGLQNFGATAGVFYSVSDTGHAYLNTSSRLVITP